MPLWRWWRRKRAQRLLDVTERLTTMTVDLGNLDEYMSRLAKITGFDDRNRL